MTSTKVCHACEFFRVGRVGGARRRGVGAKRSSGSAERILRAGRGGISPCTGAKRGRAARRRGAAGKNVPDPWAQHADAHAQGARQDRSYSVMVCVFRWLGGCERRLRGEEKTLDPETKSASRGTTPGKPVSAKEGRMNRVEQEPGQSSEDCRIKI